MAMLTTEQQRKVKETSVFAHCAAMGLQLAGVIHTAEEIIEVAYAMEQYHRSMTKTPEQIIVESSKCYYL